MRSRRAATSVSGVALLMAAGGLVWIAGTRPVAAELRVNPVVGVEQAIDLTARGNDDVAVWTELTAGIDATVDTRRARGQIGYQFRQRIEEIGEVSNQQAHSLLGRLTVDVVREFLTLDTGANASLVDTRPGFVSVGSAANDPNLSQTYTFYVEPRLTRRLGSFAALEASYRYTYFDVDDPRRGIVGPLSLPDIQASDSMLHQADIRLRNQPRSERVSWSLVGSFSDENSDLLDQRFRTYRGRAEIEFALNSTLSLLGSAGYEDVRNTELPIRYDGDGFPLIGPDGDFVIDVGAPRRTVYAREGETWDAGFRLTPSRRTMLLVRAGRQAGGRTSSVEFFYRPSDRLGITASWNEDLTTTTRQLSSNIAGIPLDFILRNIGTPDPSGCVLGRDPGTGACVNLGAGTLNNSAFRGQIGQIGVEFGKGRLRSRLAVNYYNRRYLDSQQLIIPNFPEFSQRRYERAYGATGQLQYDLDAARSIGASAYVQRTESNIRFFDRRDWVVGARADYLMRLSRNIDLGARADLAQRFSNNLADERTAVLAAFARYRF